MGEHEVIIIGGGHNGLTVAGYLAKAGIDVLVLEKNEAVGGACLTKEMTLPGFKHESAAIVMHLLQCNPLILKDELGLESKYGLKWLDVKVPSAFVYDDARAVIFYPNVDRTCDSISKISPEDAERYRDYITKVQPLMKMLTESLFNPPMPLTAVMAQLDSSPEGREFLRWMFMSPLDLAEEIFEHEKIRLWFTMLSLESTMGPTCKGTGLGPIIYGPMIHGFPTRIPVGGSSALPNALSRAIEDNGGKIRTNAAVKTVRLSAGRSTSVVLEGGEEIKAKKAIVSNLDPRLLFGNIVENTPEEFKKRIKTIQDPDFEIMMMHYALNESTKWYCDEVNQAKPLCISMGSTLQETLEEYSDIALNRHKMTISATSVMPTWVDPSKAPAGKHIFQYGSHERYQMKDWDRIKEKKADLYDSYIREHYIENFTYENILKRVVLSPIDMEVLNPNIYRGQVMGPAGSISQMLNFRPLPEIGGYRTPVEGLYLCGLATHPGGGISCGGRATVQTVMEDLGINFQDLFE